MFSLLFFAVLCASCLAAPDEHYSFSPPVGPGGGTSFSTAGDGGIRGIRVWESINAYITGLQVRNGFSWSNVIGRTLGDAQELELCDDEYIIQISGKYSTSYIYQLIFVTSTGRSLIVGQPTHTSFNFYPIHCGCELKMLSGRYTTSGIKSLGAHWGSRMISTNTSVHDY
ncbi:zymogen granule membrane protein 16-like isoform X1 [Epinephelus fuscoguttatus]|uniref:zymogen granule membrane protein 16-like isoform X1 n=1 Tax=Epinephelus fuscoguttatus TaxID=293821 RepID=UPI0020D0535E|nr:zymogen granule membrane protein 16-like isoform X1 [Epinephelus fuscoguttatus]